MSKWFYDYYLWLITFLSSFMVGVHSCLRRGLLFMWKNRALFHPLVLWILWLQIHLDIAVDSTTPFAIHKWFRTWSFLPSCQLWDCWGFLLFLPSFFLFKLFLQPHTWRLFWCSPGGKLCFCRKSKKGAVSKELNKINYKLLEEGPPLSFWVHGGVDGLSENRKTVGFLN